MRNELKILIAAIVVIIIVLVGAFALGGTKNTQVSITPTPVAVTATPAPTPVPIGGGQGGAATPTAVVSVVPTITPTPTPTPENASGVKQTEFGYWITYPPLGPENWSSPHSPPSSGYDNNTVYFDGTSGHVVVGPPTEEYYGIPVIIKHTGDWNTAVPVHVHLDVSDNIWLDSLYTWYYIDNPNVQFSDENDFNITFPAGVNSETMWVYFEGLENTNELTALADSFDGSIVMTIVPEGNAYKVGANNVYTLTASGEATTGKTLEFATDKGYIINGTGLTFTGPNNSGQYQITVALKRTGTLTDTYTPTVTGPTANFDTTDRIYVTSVDPFAANQDTTYVHMIYNPYGVDVSHPYADFGLSASGAYTVGIPPDYHLDLYMPIG